MYPCLPPPPLKFSITKFLLGITVVPREIIEDNGYEKFLGVSKLHFVLYGNAEQLFLV